MNRIRSFFATRTFLIGTLAVGLAMTALTPGTTQAQDRPNIVLITVDNLGYGDLGVYGNEAMKTPNLDNLAGQGVRLTSFYTGSPTCATSRIAQLTGKVPQRTGINHQMGSKKNINDGLPGSEMLLPEYLKEVGYATGAFGKWNVGFQPGGRPTEQGFDEFFGHRSGNIDYYSQIYKGQNDLYRDTTEVVLPGYNYATGLWTEAAKEFMADHRNEPFFLYLPYNAPHFPSADNKKPGEEPVWQAPDSVFQRYGYDPDTDDPKKRYRAVVTALDNGIGEVLDQINALDLRENTIVIFYSDNGAFMFENRGLEVASNAPLRNGGTTLWEGGIRVPAMVRWPGEIPAGSVVREPLWSMDFFSMAIEVAGAQVPDGRPVDGKNPIPTLKGEADSPHEYLFWEFGEMSVVRGERYKLVRAAPGEDWGLYDLKRDVRESENIAAQHPEKVEELRSQFKNWIDEVGRVDYPSGPERDWSLPPAYPDRPYPPPFTVQE